MARVLIADKLDSAAAEILTGAGVEVTVQIGLDEAQLCACIADYEGIIVRSATRVTEKVIQAGTKLKIIGRAGVGVDNIDLAAATARGIVVMNTPLGNVISAAEHTLGMLFSLARHIPEAHADLRNGVWNRKLYMGHELAGKCLGVVGLGKIGQHVAGVCRAMKMTVLGFDPYLNPERAAAIGVELMELDALLARSDFVTLHVPKTPKTKGMINAAALARMQPHACLINVARGGLVDEAALAEALRGGQIAGAAVDVYSSEPVPPDHPLLAAPNVILTPHLGASTSEAQSKVAEDISRQFVAFFERNEISNAVNLKLNLAPEHADCGALAVTLGSLAAQLAGAGIRRVSVRARGKLSDNDARALAVCVLSGVLQTVSDTAVNLVNAARIAELRGIELVEERRSKPHSHRPDLLCVKVETPEGSRRVTGACYRDMSHRIVEIDGLSMELRPAENLLIMWYQDRPGVVGTFGSILGEAGINIAGMEVGRREKGGDAIVVLTLDEPLPEAVVEKIRDAVQPHELHLIHL